MPQIIVTAGSTYDLGETTVMWRERVAATDFESDRFATNLLERLGWAVEDATAAEEQGFAEEHSTPEWACRDQRQREPGWDPGPFGAA